MDADFEAVQKQIIIDNPRAQSDLSVGQEHLDVLAGIAAAQSPRVDLVVTGFDVGAVFGQEVEADEGPGSVLPLGADQEGDVR